MLVSREQQHQLDTILREGGLDTDADVPALRAAFIELAGQVPVAPDVQQKAVEIGSVPGIEVTIRREHTEDVILYFHGGVYVIGNAAASVPLVSDLVRRTGTKAVTIDYRTRPRSKTLGPLTKDYWLRALTRARSRLPVSRRAAGSRLPCSSTFARRPCLCRRVRT